MLEVEIQKLTAAIEALTKVMQTMSLPTVTINAAEQSYREDNAAREKMQAERTAKRKPKVTPEETEALVEAATGGSSSAADVVIPANTTAKEIIAKSAIKEESPKSPEPEKIAAIISDAISESDIKTLAMEIARADSSARPLILGILGEYGAKTITQLDFKHYHAVHGRLLSLAHDIAKDGEPI